MAEDTEDIVAITHEDDLQLFEGIVRTKSKCWRSFPKSVSNAFAQDTLTANAIEKFLRDEKMPLLIENGGVSCISNTSRNVGLSADFNSGNSTWPSG